MRPGRLPAEYHAYDGIRRRRFSMSLAIVLILGPAVFLGILAYEGAVADEPAPFDDDPAHHHRDVSTSGPLRFCTYLDEENYIQAKAGPCNDNKTQGTQKKHGFGVLRDFCIEKMSNETFDIVNCSESIISPSPLEPRQLHVPSDLCLHKNSSTRFEVVPCDGNEDFRIQGRRKFSPHISCYTARPGGWWEPCYPPDIAKHSSETKTEDEALCLHSELDSSGTAIHNSNCSNIHQADQPPEHYIKCDNINPENGKIEIVKCYTQAGPDHNKIVQCPENTKQPRGDFINSDGQSNQDEIGQALRPDGILADVDHENFRHVRGSEPVNATTGEDWCFEVCPDQNTRAVACPAGLEPGEFLPHEYDPLLPHLLGRASPSIPPNSSTIADKPGKWKGTERCTKDFCRWANTTGEIKNRCYAKDDNDPNTPPTPDEALKYTAPFECNLCLEDGAYYEDKEHIQRHCTEVMVKEDLILKILAGVIGGIMLIMVICGICWEQRRLKRSLKNPFLKSEMTKYHSSERSQRTPVLPPFDGAADLRLSMLSLTASQRDAPEIQIKSRSHSGTSRGASNPEIRIIAVPQPIASTAERDSRSIPHFSVPAEGGFSCSHLQSLRSEDARKTSSSSQSLSSEEERQRMCGRKVCLDCNSSTFEREESNHACDKVKCKDCNQCIRANQSEEHPCSLPYSGIPSERQPVMQPALTRSTENV